MGAVFISVMIRYKYGSISIEYFWFTTHLDTYNKCTGTGHILGDVISPADPAICCGDKNNLGNIRKLG